MKRKFLICTALLLAILLCTMTAFAETDILPAEQIELAEPEASSGSLGGSITWALADDGVLTISGTGSTNVSKAPWKAAEVKQLVIAPGITNVGASLFLNHTALKAVTLPDTVTVIETSAFSGCTALTRIDIPASVLRVAPYAFSGCSALTEVNMEVGTYEIGDFAFRNTRISKVSLPDSVWKVGEGAFSGTAMTELNLGRGVQDIGALAFDSYTGCVRLPVSVKTLGSRAFDTAGGVLIESDRISLGAYCFRLAKVVRMNEDCAAFTPASAQQNAGPAALWVTYTGTGLMQPLHFMEKEVCLGCGYTGTAPAPATGTLIKESDGSWGYYVGGVQDTQFFGFVEYSGGKFLVAHGKVAAHISGLAQDPEHPDDWYFLASGQAQTHYTGLVLYDGAWFYVSKGVLDTNISQVVEYDGGLFLVARGRIVREKDGLGQDPVTHKWYYFAGGQVQNHYTGLVQYDSAWFYVAEGVLQEDFTGEVTYHGRQFFVRNGHVVL